MLDALITAAYAALQNARQSELQDAVEDGNQNAKIALRLVDQKAHLYVTYSLMTTLLNFGLVLVMVALLVIPAATGTLSISIPIAMGIILSVSLVVMVFGNVLPEAIGSAYAMTFINLSVRPMRALVGILSPITNFLLWISRLLARLFGSDQLVNTVTEEEIMTLVNSGSTIEDGEKRMIMSVMQLDETLSREMMIPRIDMVALEVNTTIREAVETLVSSGFSRIPIYEDNIDNILGVLYAKDILNLLTNGGIEGHTVRDLVRSAYFVPETRPADDLLRDLQARNVHMAIVVDEYGGTSGLVTIENIMEEIVGDIRDEYDTEEEYEYIKNSDDEYIIDAGMDLDDVNNLLDVTLDTDASDTLGGYIYLNIGRVPIVGETIDTDEMSMRVRSLEGRRIRKVLVKLKPRPSDMSERQQQPNNDDNGKQEELADAS